MKQKNRRNGGKRGGGQSLRMDHGFLCLSGVYSVVGALVMAVDARVLMDTPDSAEKNVPSLGLG